MMVLFWWNTVQLVRVKNGEIKYEVSVQAAKWKNLCFSFEYTVYTLYV